MILQAAIDRVSCERAAEIIRLTDGQADLIEVGTSLIKDFGLQGSVGVLKKQFPSQKLLADIKTCDEGAYEFQKSYEAGADVATVMGFSSAATIRACADTARAFKRDYMIDLLEVPDEKLLILLKEFPDAIFAIHLPADLAGEGLEALVRHMTDRMGKSVRIAAAGGVKLDSIPLLKECGVEIGIVGSGITKAPDIKAATAAFSAAMHTSI